MPNPKRTAADLALAPALIYSTASTCGVLAALAVQIQLSRVGFDPVGLWQNLSTPGAMQLRSAGPWWAVPAVAFVMGGLIAAVLSRMPLPWRRFRLLRWLGAAVIVFILAEIGQNSAELATGDPGANVLADLGVLTVAALMSLGGAYLTIRR
ncbi:MAG TPA: hypothetical protein VH678_21340 [Xanthobacteraceae bacterium]|jgi:hypothetical protein